MARKSWGILQKIRKYGIWGSFRKLLKRLLKSGGVYWRLAQLIIAPAYRQRRILGIWDYKALPWSIGDPLVFMEMLSVIKLEADAEAVDVCVVYDRDNPNGIRSRPGKDIITAENAQDYMLELLPLFGTSPYIGSIFQFNSRREFYSFLKNNLQRYDIFPPLAEHLAETYNYVGSCKHFLEVQDFHKRHGYVPYLKVNDRDMSWAKWFYKIHLGKNSVPVTLSLRRSLTPDERNADPGVWMNFLDRCKESFPEVVFVTVGLREETLEGLRNRPNVLIAKDFGTSILEDMALIRNSLLYMGTNSGINTIAQFSDLPYIIFQFPVQSLHTVGFKSGENFNFATKDQRVFTTDIEVTPDFLFEKFKKLYARLDHDAWRGKVSENARNKHTHPSSKVADLKS